MVGHARRPCAKGGSRRRSLRQPLFVCGMWVISRYHATAPVDSRCHGWISSQQSGEKNEEHFFVAKHLVCNCTCIHLPSRDNFSVHTSWEDRTRGLGRTSKSSSQRHTHAARLVHKRDPRTSSPRWSLFFPGKNPLFTYLVYRRVVASFRSAVKYTPQMPK